MKKSQLRKIIRESIKQLMTEQTGQMGNFQGSTEVIPCTLSGGIRPIEWAWTIVAWQPWSYNQPGKIDISGCYRVEDTNGNLITSHHSATSNVKVNGLGADPNAWYILGNYSTSPTPCSNPIATITMHTGGITQVPGFPMAFPPGQGCTPNFSGPVIQCKKNPVHWKFGGTCEEVTSSSPSGIPGNPGWTSIKPTSSRFFNTMYDCKLSDCEQGLGQGTSLGSGGGKDPITPLTTDPQSIMADPEITDPQIDRMQNLAKIKKER